MSRVGKSAIAVPDQVELEFEGQLVKVVGPRGTLSERLPEQITIEKNGDSITLINKEATKRANSLHGTFRSKIANMVKGVTSGWVRTLELVGTGYRAEVDTNTLILTVGFSHPVKVVAPPGISFKVEKTAITVEGPDRELVGQIAAKIRSIRPPEPYKGKGIKYQEEVVRRKAGKVAKAEAAPA